MISQNPNVIVFLTDQQRHDTLGIHGCPLDLTPNLDRVATRSSVFTNAITPFPICTPARSCIQTGMYATDTGCFRNGIAMTKAYPTLADYFNEAGYYTGYIGKWHLADKGIVPRDQRGGYQYWLGANSLESCSSAYDLVMYDDAGNPVRVPGYRVDGVTDCAIDFIDEHQKGPFFLFVSFLEPHNQNCDGTYLAPEGYAERYSGRWMPRDLAALGGNAHQTFDGYCGTVRRLDEAYGRMIDALKSLRLLDDTVVVFTSDHGDHFMTRNTTHKMSVHESSVHIPLIISGPGFRNRGRIDDVVSLIDIVPTLLDAAGIDIPVHVRGRSLVPLCQQYANAWPEEAYIQVSTTECSRAIRSQKWKYAVTAEEVDPKTTIHAESYTEAALYDLEHDPCELQNLISFDAFDAVKAKLRKRLRNKMIEVGETQAEIVPASNNQLPIGILPQIAPIGEVWDDANNPTRYYRRHK